MSEFDLVSVDWDTVRLLQAGQFKLETHYLEELTRWVLQRGRIYGLLHLADKGVRLPSPEVDGFYKVSVHGCIAIARGGQMIEIPDDERMAITKTIKPLTDILVPLYIGVSMIERAKDPDLHPSVDVGLLGCGGKRRRYVLAFDDSDSNFDWLQVAQFRKTPKGLVVDEAYIPDCMFLSSHAGQMEAQKQIGNLAAQALKTLVEHSSASPTRFTVAATLAGSLGAAAMVVDGRLMPRAYVDRLAGVFSAQHSQLLALPSGNLTAYKEAVDYLKDTIDYLANSDWTMGQALIRATECFERLLQLYPPLLKSLEAMAPKVEWQPIANDPAVPAEYSRAAQPPVDSGDKPKGGFMWRK